MNLIHLELNSQPLSSALMLPRHVLMALCFFRRRAVCKKDPLRRPLQPEWSSQPIRKRNCSSFPYIIPVAGVASSGSHTERTLLLPWRILLLFKTCEQRVVPPPHLSLALSTLQSDARIVEQESTTVEQSESKKVCASCWPFSWIKGLSLCHLEPFNVSSLVPSGKYHKADTVQLGGKTQWCGGERHAWLCRPHY